MHATSVVPGTVLLLLLGGCGADEAPGSAPDPEPTSASPTFVAPDEPPDGVTVTDLDAGPVGLATVDDAVWAVLPDAGAVRDPDGGTHRVGDVPLRAVTTPDGIWVSVFGESRLVRLDPATGDVDRRVRVRPAGEPEGLAFDGDSVWVVDQANEVLLPLDPASGELGRPVEVGAAPRLAAVGEDAVYVGNFNGRSVSRVRAGAAETRPSGDCLTPQGLAVAGGVVWVACTLDGRVVGLDAATLEQVVVLEGLPHADMVVPDGDLVHVVGQQGPTVWTIDVAAQEVVGELVLDGAGPTNANVAATLAGDRLVVSHPEARRLYDVPLELLGSPG
jgi:hypothetical protein